MIEAEGVGGHKIYYYEGHVYNLVKNGKYFYYKCRHKKGTRCEAMMREFEDGSITVTGKHKELPNYDFVEQNAMENKMIQEAKESPGSPISDIISKISKQ